MVFMVLGTMDGDLRLNCPDLKPRGPYLVTQAPYPHTLLPGDGHLKAIFKYLKAHEQKPESPWVVTTQLARDCFIYEIQAPKFYRLKVNSYKNTPGRSGLP